MKEEYIIEKDGRKRKAVHSICKYCGKDFLVRKSWKDTQHYCSKNCSFKAREKRIKVTCSYCGVEFEKVNSKLLNSKSGLYFCCREHKDLSQRISFGLKKIQPSHYGSCEKDYRKIAFENYPHKCARCGWDEDERILQVHHIDGNHSNNKLDNLSILCPNCHCGITLGIYNLKK